MKKIGAAKFKAQCLALLDDLDPEGLIVTKRGKPVARVVPFPKQPVEVIGALKGKVKVKADILSTGLAWEANAKS